MCEGRAQSFPNSQCNGFSRYFVLEAVYLLCSYVDHELSRQIKINYHVVHNNINNDNQQCLEQLCCVTTVRIGYGTARIYAIRCLLHRFNRYKVNIEEELAEENVHSES